MGLQIGPDFSTLDTVYSLDSSTAGVAGATDVMFTGIYTHPIPNPYDFDNMFCWRQSGPTPGTICGIYPDMEVQDRG